MKRLIVLSVLGAWGVAAQAQSTVTLYGIIDEGLTFTSNSGGHHAYQMSSGYVAGSRWGLRGKRTWAAG